MTPYYVCFEVGILVDKKDIELSNKLSEEYEDINVRIESIHQSLALGKKNLWSLRTRRIRSRRDSRDMDRSFTRTAARNKELEFELHMLMDRRKALVEKLKELNS